MLKMANISSLLSVLDLSRDELIVEYFKEWFTYKETLSLLEKCHGIKIALRTLHRVLRLRQLRRRGKIIDTRVIVQAIKEVTQVWAIEQCFSRLLNVVL